MKANVLNKQCKGKEKGMSKPACIMALAEKKTLGICIFLESGPFRGTPAGVPRWFPVLLQKPMDF